MKEVDVLIDFLKDIGESGDLIWLNFWNYHLQHPDVEFQLRNLALNAKRAGLKVYGIGAIWEVLRWRLRVEGGRIEEFKCSNDYRSRYARFLMWRHPELQGFFVLRELRSGKVGA
jgi:hypothetical protein